ncbi:MAG: SciE type virulence protein [Phycisphaerales bacterium]|nr:SciE type virulence protein [Phycisphaerales bacterium]
MKALEAFNAGRLADAVKLATDEVRNAPQDVAARYVLAEMLCFIGEFERADNQLDTAVTLDPSKALSIIQFRQLVRGEQARQDCFTAGRPPQFLVDPSPGIRDRLGTIVQLRAGDVTAARAALERAEAARSPRSGSCNGKPFDDLRDADDTVADVLEVLTGDGRYFWVPFELVQSVQFEKPERARDLLFRQAELLTSADLNGPVFIPTLYAGTHRDPRDEMRLGRGTDWVGEGPVRGVGQRVWIAGEEDPAILQVETIEMQGGAPA